MNIILPEVVIPLSIYQLWSSALLSGPRASWWPENYQDIPFCSFYFWSISEMFALRSTLFTVSWASHSYVLFSTDIGLATSLPYLVTQKTDGMYIWKLVMMVDCHVVRFSWYWCISPLFESLLSTILGVINWRNEITLRNHWNWHSGTLLLEKSMKSCSDHNQRPWALQYLWSMRTSKDFSSPLI